MFLGSVSLLGVPLLVKKEEEDGFIILKSTKTGFPKNFIAGTSHLLPLAILTQMIVIKSLLEANKQNQTHGLFYSFIIRAFLYSLNFKSKYCYQY